MLEKQWLNLFTLPVNTAYIRVNILYIGVLANTASITLGAPSTLLFGHKTMLLKKLLFILCLVCIPPAILHAENNGFKEITAPETKLMMDENPSTLLINVLSSLEYELQHITNSISIPVNQLKNSPLLPEDKNVPLIFYCMGPR